MTSFLRELSNTSKMRISQVSFAVLIIWVVTATYLLLTGEKLEQKSCESTFTPRETGPTAPTYKQLDGMVKNEVVQKCVDSSLLHIGGLPKLVDTWHASKHLVCRQLHQLFSSIYTIESRTGTLNITKSLQAKMLGWFGGNADLVKQAEVQTVIFLLNKWTFGGTIFNPIRDKRPVKKPKISDRQYVAELAKSAESGCDFCSNAYKQFTAPDFYGRIESKHCYTASNAFKLDAWHALVIFRKHTPSDWSKEELMDAFDTSMKWFRIINQHHKDFIYPMIFWDLLPHASASQVHPHIHLVLTNSAYWGHQEGWIQVGERYQHQFGRVFLDDIASIHNILGLQVRHRTATAFASITPKKDHEVMITARAANRDFYEMAYFTARAYIDDLEKMCFSMAITLPPLSPEKAGKVKAHLRMVSRGTVSEVRSDVSSMELFSASNVNVDPFKFAKVLQQSVEKRIKS